MLNERIKSLRKQSGYSQKQVALKLGITQGAVSQWESGITVPAAEQLISLSEIFGVSVDEILGVEPKQPTDEFTAFKNRRKENKDFDTLIRKAENSSPEHIKAAIALLDALEPFA